MNEEIKPCPFCRSENHPYHKEGCFLINVTYATIEAYNSRPIEDDLRAENERLREALKFYRDEKNWEDISGKWGDPYDSVCLRDQGEVARRALEEGAR